MKPIFRTLGTVVNGGHIKVHQPHGRHLYTCMVIHYVTRTRQHWNRYDT